MVVKVFESEKIDFFDFFFTHFWLLFQNKSF